MDIYDIPNKYNHCKPYAYVGDVNPEYGGMWLDLSDLRYGYAPAVRVTDLDSACGYSGAVLVEHITILYDRDRIREAIQSCGCKVRGPEWICSALESYGHYDPDDSWDGHRSPWSQVVQCDPTGPTEFDGWTAAHVLSEGEDLVDYLAETHL